MTGIGYTPVWDWVVQEVGLDAAVVYGVVYRYSQTAIKKCCADISTMAECAGMTRQRFMRHVATLLDSGLIIDLTPDVRGMSHEYELGKRWQTSPIDGAGNEGDPPWFVDSGRQAVLNKTNGRCGYCGIALDGRWQIDHMHPRCKGGSDAPNNLIASCPACNTKKSGRTVDEFRAMYEGGVTFYFETLER